MQHQVKIRFLASSIQDYDELVLLEDELISALGDNHDVDGHDFGEGEFNIFILTDTPESLTANLLALKDLRVSKRAVEITIRELPSDKSKVIWPKV